MQYGRFAAAAEGDAHRAAGALVARCGRFADCAPLGAGGVRERGQVGRGTGALEACVYGQCRLAAAGAEGVARVPVDHAAGDGGEGGLVGREIHVDAAFEKREARVGLGFYEGRAGVCDGAFWGYVQGEVGDAFVGCVCELVGWRL